MPTVTIAAYRVTPAMLIGAPGAISTQIALTIADDDATLHIDNFADPGTDQIFTSPSLPITMGEVIFRVSVTYTPIGSTTPVTLTGAVVNLTNALGANYYFISDSGSSFPGLGPGVTVRLTNRVAYTNYIRYDTIACFAQGTLIDTARGQFAVEHLQPGDLVQTRDRGPRPLSWIGRADLSCADLARRPDFRPIRLRAGTLGDGLPKRDLLLSPQHRVLLEGWRVELWLGEAEALAPVRRLLGWPGVALAGDVAALSYFHLMFDRHEIVFAEGLPVESFYFGDRMRDGLPPSQIAEILALFPELAVSPPAPARRFARSYEVAALGAAGDGRSRCAASFS